MDSTLNTIISSERYDDEDIKIMDDKLNQLKEKLTSFSHLPDDARYQYYQRDVTSIINYFLGSITRSNDNNINEIYGHSDFQLCEVLQVITGDLIKFSDNVDIIANFNGIRATLNIIHILFNMTSTNVNDVKMKSRINDIFHIMTVILGKSNSTNNTNSTNSNTKYLVYDTLLVIRQNFRNISSSSVDITIGFELIKQIDNIFVKIYSDKSDDHTDDVVELVLGSLSSLASMQPQLVCDFKIVENGIPVYGILAHIIRYIGSACMQHSTSSYLDICRDILKVFQDAVKKPKPENRSKDILDTLKGEINIINKEFCSLIKTSNEDHDTISCYWNNWMKALSIFIGILPTNEKSITIISLFNTVEAKNAKKRSMGRVLVTKLSGIFEKYSRKEHSLYLATFLLSAVQTITPVIKNNDLNHEKNVTDWLSHQIYINLLIQIFRCLNKLVLGIIDDDDCSDQLVEKVIEVITTIADCCWLTATYSNESIPASIFHLKYKSTSDKSGDDRRYPLKFIDLIKYVLELRSISTDEVSKRRRLSMLQMGMVRVMSAVFENGKHLITCLQNDVDKDEVLNRGLFAQQSSSLSDNIKIPNQSIITEYLKLIELCFCMLVDNLSKSEIVCVNLVRCWQIGINSLGRIVDYLPGDELLNTYDDGQQHVVLQNLTHSNRIAEISEIYSMVRHVWSSFWRHSYNQKYDFLRGLFIESFWWYLHRMSAFNITIRDENENDSLISLLSLYADIEIKIIDDSIVNSCPNRMAGFALILTMAHGRLTHIEEKRVHDEESSEINGGSKSLNLLKWAVYRSVNLLKWAVYRSVNGMLQTFSMLPILRLIARYIADSGVTEAGIVNKIHGKADVVNSFIAFERSLVIDDRFNIAVISSIVSAALNNLGQLSGHSELQESQSQQSQLFQQSSTTPLTPDTEAEMIEGFGLLLGLPLILMSKGHNVFQCIIPPQKPWSDVIAGTVDIDSNKISASDWEKLFITWLRDLHRSNICRSTCFHNSIIHQYGGIFVTGTRSPSLSQIDFKCGIEVLTSALNVIRTCDPGWQLSSQIRDTIGFNIYQAWVNLTLSWTNVMTNGYEDSCDIDALIVKPEQVLSPLLSLLITIVKIFGNYYISPTKLITIFKEAKIDDDDDDDGDGDDGGNDDDEELFSKESSSFRAVLSNLFKLPILIMKPSALPNPTPLKYIEAETVMTMKQYSSSYIITILECLIKLAEELSQNSCTDNSTEIKIGDILEHDLIKKMITKSNNLIQNSTEINRINELFLKLSEMMIEKTDAMNNSLGKRKSLENNDDKEHVSKREKVPENLIAKIDEIEMFIEEKSDCYNEDKREKIKAHLDEVRKLL